MKKSIFYSLSLLIGLILFYVALQEIGLENISSAVSKVSFGQFLFALVVLFSGFLIGTLRWLIIARSQISPTTSFLDVLIARLVGFSISYLTPVIFLGGQPFKAYVLKERTKSSIDKIVVSIILEEAVFLTVLFLFVVFGVVFLILKFDLPNSLRNIVFGVTLFCLFIFCFFYYRIIKKSSKGKGFFGFFIEALRLDRIDFIGNIKERIDRVETEVSNFFRHQRIKLVTISFLSIIELLFSIISYKLIINFLGGHFNLTEVISINALINLIYFLPIPAALGSFEWSQAIIFNIFGMTLETGIAFSLIVRIINLILVAFGIIFLLHFEVKILLARLGESVQKLTDFLNSKNLLK